MKIRGINCASEYNDDTRIELDIDIDRRDLFAAFALVGMIRNGNSIKDATLAEMAYIYADSMEEARETK